MDRAAGVLAEARVGFCVINIEVVVLKEVELVLSETQFPGNVAPADGEGVIMFWDEGHGVIVK